MSHLSKWLLGILTTLTLVGGAAWANNLDNRIRSLEQNQIPPSIITKMSKDMDYIRDRVDKLYDRP